MERNKTIKLKQLIIKPLKEQWIMWIILSFLVVVIIICLGIIISVFVSDKIPWTEIGLFLIIYLIIIVLLSVISRISYKGKLIVTENEIIKMHGKKEQFHIKKKDLLFIGVRKTNIFVKLLVIISAFIGDLCTDVISFRFYRADAFEIRKFGGCMEMCSLTEEELNTGMQEFVECLTYRQAVKISKLMHVPIKEVVF